MQWELHCGIQREKRRARAWRTEHHDFVFEPGHLLRLQPDWSTCRRVDAHA